MSITELDTEHRSYCYRSGTNLSGGGVRASGHIARSHVAPRPSDDGRRRPVSSKPCPPDDRVRELEYVTAGTSDDSST